MDQMQNLLATFVTSFQSENTRKAYFADVKEFFLFCEKDLQLIIERPDQITERLVLVWQKKCTQLPNATVARKMATLSSFLEFLKNKKHISKNFMKKMKRRRVEKDGKTNILTADELEKILGTTFQNTLLYKDSHPRLYQLWHLRFAVLHTLFSVGMRVEELCSLKIKSLEDLGNDIWRLHMIVKGHETHAPIVHKNTAHILREHIELFRYFSQKDDPLFVRAQKRIATNKETPLHRSSVFHMIRLCAKEAGIVKKISPHSARATLATLLHRQGVPIGQIQSLLNHKQMTTTGIYIKKSDEIAQAAAMKIDFLETL